MPFLCLCVYVYVQVPAESLHVGSLFPPFDNIRNVTALVAEAVARDIFDSNRATVAKPSGNLLEFIKSNMYEPKYRNYE